MINRPRSDTAIVLILSALAILVLVAGCSDSSEPVTPPAPELTVFGGPDNPASDGSYTAEIVSVNGIATLETVSLGGVDQWVMIRGYDVDNPVLVFLHGGPGSPAIPYARFSFGGLEHDFTVVSWDQRGCGKSFDEGLDPSSITLDRMLADTRELIELMRGRFGVQRIYLMGISWGSILGTLTARDHPELLHAYIGVGQVVNYTNSIPIAHAAALDRATALGLDDAIAALSSIQVNPINWDQVPELGGWLEVLGLGDIHDHSLLPGFAEEAGPLTEYTSANSANEDAWRAFYASTPLLADETWLRTLNMLDTAPRLEVPVFFLSGRYDYKAPGVQVQDYLAALEAPAGKQMFWFENSAHVPFIEERGEFHSILIQEVLASE
jgi:pimeloyl-ACP methyl ester carboxylesterase